MSNRLYALTCPKQLLFSHQHVICSTHSCTSLDDRTLSIAQAKNLESFFDLPPSLSQSHTLFPIHQQVLLVLSYKYTQNQTISLIFHCYHPGWIQQHLIAGLLKCSQGTLKYKSSQFSFKIFDGFHLTQDVKLSPHMAYLAHIASCSHLFTFLLFLLHPPQPPCCFLKNQTIGLVHETHAQDKGPSTQSAPSCNLRHLALNH